MKNMSRRVSAGTELSVKRNKKWAIFMGDFPLLRDALSKRKQNRRAFLWHVIGLLDAFARGVGQVVFANNPISGAMIFITIAITYPQIALFGAITGFIGLFVSMLIRDPVSNVDNGLTVYNPLLIGIITSALLPEQCTSGDSVTLLLIFIATIFSVFLTRAIGSGKRPVVTIPFNIVEIMILTVLKINSINHLSSDFHGVLSNIDCQLNNETILNTSILINGGNQSICEIKGANATEHIDWGMLLHGIVTSASQVFGVNDVIVGSFIYLAMPIYSPTSAIFTLIGAIIGCLLAIELGVPYESIYSGLWGYNSFLACCALGGIFIVLNAQTVVLAFIVAAFTVLLQYVLQFFFSSMQLSVLTIPFVVTSCLFITIRDAEDNVFPRPRIITFPEEQRAEFLSKRESSNEDSDSPSV